MKVFEYLTKINPLEKLYNPLNAKIYIGPNNKVLILHKDYRTAEQDSINFDQNGVYLCSWISCFTFSKKFLRVDANTMQNIKKILERKNAKQHEENEKNQLKNQVHKLENDLEKLLHMIKQNDQTSQNILHKLNQIQTKHKFEINV